MINKGRFWVRVLGFRNKPGTTETGKKKPDK